MNRRLIIFSPLAVLALGAGALSCFIIAGQPVPTWLAIKLPANLTAAETAVWLHAISGALAALFAALCTPARGAVARLTLFNLYFALALTLPVLGLACLGALVAVLCRPPAALQAAEEKFICGLPRLAGTDGGTDAPDLEPLVHRMRTIPRSELGSLVLGLKNLGASGQNLPFLRRYQTDADPQLQFYAQGLLTSAHEELESSLKYFETRAASAEAGTAAANHLSAAEICLDLARLASPADIGARVHAVAALDHLAAAPSSAHSHILRAEAHLMLDDTPAARAAVTAAQQLDPDTVPESLDFELTFNERRRPAPATA